MTLVKFGLSVETCYSERAPDTAELYSDGAHHATESYDVGTSTLDTESTVGIEIILQENWQYYRSGICISY